MSDVDDPEVVPESPKELGLTVIFVHPSNILLLFLFFVYGHGAMFG